MSSFKTLTWWNISPAITYWPFLNLRIPKRLFNKYGLLKRCWFEDVFENVEAALRTIRFIVCYDMMRNIVGSGWNGFGSLVSKTSSMFFFNVIFHCFSIYLPYLKNFCKFPFQMIETRRAQDFSLVTMLLSSFYNKPDLKVIF